MTPEGPTIHATKEALRRVYVAAGNGIRPSAHHQIWCGRIKVMNRPKAISQEQARLRGLPPCQWCHP